MSEPLLQVRELRKIYPNGAAALKGVSFEVTRGEFLVVIGLSGSGKSTLLRCLNRLTDPTSGEIHFDGRRVDGLRGAEVRALRRQIGMIFQHFNLVARATVLRNVLVGRLGAMPVCKSLLGRFSASDRAEALRSLELMGLADRAAHRAMDLSGGQQQRVAIARALAQKPQLLLADEPVASLDPATCFVVMDYLRRINRELGITVICNLHFLNLVREYATRVIALKDGQVVYQGQARDIDAHWFKAIYGEDAREI